MDPDISTYDALNEFLFAQKLERDKLINVDIGPKFDYAVEKDLNFLDATSRQSIDYSNLGNYMRFVKSEFDNAYMTKKSQKSEDQLKKQREYQDKIEKGNEEL